MLGEVFGSGGSLTVVYSGYQCRVCVLVGLGCVFCVTCSLVGGSSRSSYVGRLTRSFRVSRVSYSLSIV